MSISALFNTSRLALQAHTQAIRITGDNIANVNVEGYSRRRGDFVSRDIQPGTGVGTGVELERVTRIVDEFINTQLRMSTSDHSFSNVREELLSRAEAPFGLDGVPGKIGQAMTSFFSALEDLETNPANLSLRAQVIQAGENMVSAIRSTYDHTAALQREADDRVGQLITETNQITTAIADLNRQIATQENGDQQALALRDQRDQLMKELSELVEFQSVENSDGGNVIYLSNGFALVNGGTSRDLGFVTSPSFENAPPNNFPNALDGGRLGHIVYDFGGGEHLDLTGVIRDASGGEIAGLLSLRGVQPNPGTPTTPFDADGDLVGIAARVESIARDLLTRFNTEYLGPDLTAGAPHNPSSYTLDGSLPTAVGDVPGEYALFSFERANLLANNGDINNDGLPNDLAAIQAAGPEYASFASILTMNVSSPGDLAVGRDVDAATAGLQTANGDSQNAAALIALRDDQVTYTNPGTVASFSHTTAIEGMYNLTVAHTGSITAQSKSETQVALARQTQSQELQSSISGVSLDEEFAKLITQQRAFQSAARMITTGDQLFDEIIALIG